MEWAELPGFIITPYKSWTGCLQNITENREKTEDWKANEALWLVKVDYNGYPAVWGKKIFSSTY